MEGALDLYFQYQIQNSSNTCPTSSLELLRVKCLENKVNRQFRECKLLGALPSHHLYIRRDGNILRYMAEYRKFFLH